MRQAGRVPSQSRKLWVRAGASEDPGIAFGKGAPTLSLERAGDDHRPAACGAGVDDLVDEIDKLVRKPNGDLPAHPKMVSKWERSFATSPRGRRDLASWLRAGETADERKRKQALYPPPGLAAITIVPIRIRTLRMTIAAVSTASCFCSRSSWIVDVSR